MTPIPIWLDSDPGHDDAVAILLACCLPEVNLLGLSTVHGNATAECTFTNGVRLLEFYAADAGVKVWRGADKPLIRPTRADPEIHGADGLGGADDLPGLSDPAVHARLEHSLHLKALNGIAEAVAQTQKNGQKLTVIATGPLTNIALFFSVYPELVDGVEQIVFMGGGVGIGNRSPVAEFNILCDPEAAQIVLDIPLPKVMIPLNVTHTALLTPSRHARLLDPSSSWTEGDGPLPKPTTLLRSILSSALSFFVHSYETTFGFKDGPPLHDVLTIAYVVAPHLFRTTRYRVDVELGVSHAMGETIVDLYRYRKCDDTWGPSGLNCLVATEAEIPEIFDNILRAISLCDDRRAQRSTPQESA